MRTASIALALMSVSTAYADEDHAPVHVREERVDTVARDDEQRIAAAGPMLDGLNSHFSLRTRRKPPRANATK